jgi:hypothetical protein
MFPSLQSVGWIEVSKDVIVLNKENLTITNSLLMQMKIFQEQGRAANEAGLSHELSVELSLNVCYFE